MRNAVKTITLYHVRWLADTEDKIRSVIADVSVFGNTAVRVGDNGLSTADVYTVRIPEERGKFTISEGDWIVIGEADEENPTKAQLEKKYQTLTVVGVTDNRGKRGGHYKVVCK